MLTVARSRNRLNASRRFASDGDLPIVISGSTTRRNSFAFGSVVVMLSCRSSETAMLRNIAVRWLLVRLSFLRPWPWRIVVSYAL
ncbi:hypothetical protein D3C83_112030 [compost metagenome]